MTASISTDAVTNGKAPQPAGPSTDLGFRPQNIVKVQPACLEDLQPSYAQVLRRTGENEAAHGWYAKLSEHHLLFARFSGES
jgi:hypothetical protein